MLYQVEGIEGVWSQQSIEQGIQNHKAILADPRVDAQAKEFSRQRLFVLQHAIKVEDGKNG